jgi:dimethylaniline monooxygenase (N-oxide forming)
MSRIGIIGGGVAGLQTAKALLGKGLSPTIFEQAADVGGVWRSNYRGFGLQVPKEFYEFPGYPMTKLPRGSFPTGQQVQEYIKSYYDNNAAVKAITKTNLGVKRVEQRAGSSWTFTLSDGTKAEFDYCVVATGMYSTPQLPKFENQDAFLAVPGNKIVHSSEYVKGAQPSDKVVVVGGAKSAFDVCVDVANVSTNKVVLVQRQGHWGTPRKIAGLIPFQYVFLSRFGQGLVSAHVGVWPTKPSPALRMTHKTMSYVTPPVFRLVELIFSTQLGYRPSPPSDVVHDFYGYGHVMDSDFKQVVKAGRVESVTHPGPIKLSARGVELVSPGKGGASKSLIECNTLVCATGFKKDYSIFDEATRQALDVQPDGLYLYRHMIPPRVPTGLAFVGSEAASISNIATHYLQAEWLAGLLSGKFKLPSQEAMASEVESFKAWKREWMPNTPSRANLVLLHQVHYHDALLEDLGLSGKRKSNPLLEVFAPYEPQDYAGVGR